MNEIYRRKPTWLTRAAFEEFIQAHPRVVCSLCHDDSLTSMNVGRSPIDLDLFGGSRGQLDWVCTSCLNHGHPKGELYWNYRFYFDANINLPSLRASQRLGCHEALLQQADWFSRPFNQISGMLYTLAWIVGAGKTLAIPSLAATLNHIIRRDRGGNAPRIDRVLVLTKEQAIRDQLVQDLESDIVRYGLLAAKPRVRPVINSKVLYTPQSLDQADIWVSCVHMFYTRNGEPIPGLEDILAQFPLIIADEPHFALNQYLGLVKAAASSLFFGLTGTPITASGQQIRDFALVSLYGYSDAVENDQSMKYLVQPGHPRYSEIVQEIDIERADMMAGGKEFSTDTTETEGYALAIRPLLTVAEEVARYVADCDKRCESELIESASEHRPPDSIADLKYPSHGIILAPNIEIGKFLADHINRLLDSDRRAYPIAKGWRCEIAHSQTDDGNGQKEKAKKLGVDHPWMRSKHNGGRLDAECARLLVLIGVGREGMNNPFCNVLGIARKIDSIQALVQWIGRLIRSYSVNIDGVLHVPVAELDRGRIIIHAAHGNRPGLDEALRFILGMDDALSDLPTMKDLKNGDADMADIPDEADIYVVPKSEKLAIAGYIGHQKLAGATQIDLGFVDQLYPQGNDKRKAKAKEWATRVVSDPISARDSLRMIPELAEIPRVMREYPEIIPSDDELVRFIKDHKSKLAKFCSDRLSDRDREMFLQFYEDHVQAFHLAELAPDDSLGKIRSRLGHKVKSALGSAYRGPDNSPYSLCGTAMRIVLGAQQSEQLNDGGKYDTAECHNLFRLPDVSRDVVGWVVRKLVAKGYCPDLAAAFVIPREEEAEDAA